MRRTSVRLVIRKIKRSKKARTILQGITQVLTSLFQTQRALDRIIIIRSRKERDTMNTMIISMTVSTPLRQHTSLTLFILEDLAAKMLGFESVQR